MIARDPTQRTLYEARLKAERDARAKEDYAREEGREQGREVGELAGQARLVAILQGLADEPVQPMDELKGLGSARLMSMETDLQRRLRERS